jgi:predicted HTH domain antitoxin
MSQLIEIELPDDISAALKEDAGNLASQVRLAAAVKWYELGRLSQGKAAQVAGLSRAEFIDELSRLKVSPFQETAEEIVEGIRRLRK